MEQSQNSVEISSHVSSAEQVVTSVFRDAERLRQESKYFWQTTPFTLRSLADRIMRTKPPLSKKHTASYANLQDMIVELKKKEMNLQTLDNALFLHLKKQDVYMLESVIEHLLFQGARPTGTMENIPHFMYRYMKSGGGEYITSGDNPKLHGVLFQRLFATGFLDIDEQTFTRQMDEMLVSTHLLLSLLKDTKYPYIKRIAQGIYMRHLYGAALSAFSMIESGKYIQSLSGHVIHPSPPFDFWDNGYKVDGILFNKASGKIIGLIQSKSARATLSEKDQEVRVQNIQAEYKQQSYKSSGCTYTADFWAFPMQLITGAETIKQDDIYAKEQYKKMICQFINGARLLNFIEKESFEEQWWSIFYTSRIQLPNTKKEKYPRNSMNALIHDGKALMAQSLMHVLPNQE